MYGEEKTIITIFFLLWILSASVCVYIQHLMFVIYNYFFFFTFTKRLFKLEARNKTSVYTPLIARVSLTLYLTLPVKMKAQVIVADDDNDDDRKKLLYTGHWVLGIPIAETNFNQRKKSQLMLNSKG